MTAANADVGRAAELMDALSDVLRAVRLTGAVFFDVQASEPWVAESPPGESIVGRIFPGADHLISYHVITGGPAGAASIGQAPLHLSAGDVIVFPHGDAHVMSSAPGLRDEPDPSKLSPARATDNCRSPCPWATASADPAHLVCGFLACDARPFNPLLSALPPVIRVSDRAGGAIGAFVQLRARRIEGARAWAASACWAG